MNASKYRVLIVDDVPENIKILINPLKSHYAIMVARDGEVALQLASSSQPPDIILLDVVMPGMDGYEVCRRLKEDPQTRDIPVLFITAQSDEVDEARGLALGAVDYISKPFRPSLVMTRVANQLELKQHRDTLSEQIKERTRELAITRETTIEAMASLAEWRDTSTGGHVRRTKEYVRLLADYLHRRDRYAELDSDTCEMLYVSAPLHDVGKVSLPDSILLKPGRLTDEEMMEMRTHTTRGYTALSAVEQKLGGNSFLKIACEIAHSHHERWDGKGYPQGIGGEEIPLGARMMAIADVYDALISPRIYKNPMPHSEALRIMLEGRGTQFDPTLIDAFITLQKDFEDTAIHYADEEVHKQEAAQASAKS